MEKSSSRDWRQSWIQSSREAWQSQKDLDLPGPQCDPSPTPHTSTARPCQGVHSDGCSDGKIGSWLRGCGLETNSAELNAEHTWRNSCEDDLSLGAEASAICHGDNKSQVGPSLLPHAGNSPNCRPRTSTPRHKLPSLNFGNSMASSYQSSSTIKPTSSVSEVLQSCSEDAEETLLQLGFGHDEAQVPARVPVRFFTFPSQLEGINFRLFLQSQLQRIREEDPNLSIASRFRQVEALTAMANAFYSLYSHVSRTPLPKLTPPEPALSPSPVEMPDRFRGIGIGGCDSVRDREPRSPVGRLKDTVARMCLYTGGTRRDPERDPASPRMRPSLPEVVDIVLENAKLRAPKKPDISERSVDDRHDPHRIRDREKEEEGEQTTMTDVPTQPSSLDAQCHMVVGTGDQSDGVEADWNGVTSSDHEKSRTGDFVAIPSSLTSSLSGEAASHAPTPHESDRDPRVVCRGARNSARGIKVSHDAIFPVIVESTRHHRAPFCRSLAYNAVDTISSPHDVTSSVREASPVSWCSGPDRTQTKTCGSSSTRSRPGSLPSETRQLLCPLKHSFEMEEVSSAGEEDVGQSETTQPTSTKCQRKAAPVRGDSLQSDSSGYADEDNGSCPDSRGS